MASSCTSTSLISPAFKTLLFILMVFNSFIFTEAEQFDHKHFRQFVDVQILFHNDFKAIHAEPPPKEVAGIIASLAPVPEGFYGDGGKVITDHMKAAAAAASTLLFSRPAAAKAPSNEPVEKFIIARDIGGRRHRALRGLRFASRLSFVALAGRAPPQRWHGQSNGLSRSPSAGPRLGRGHSFPLKSQWGAKRVEKEARKSRNRCER